MPYITTNHRFIIDEKHPSDVFAEMENFFSLYTVEITDLQQVSIQLNVPNDFNITDNKKLAESYRQFIKAVQYTIPDVNVLPLKVRTSITDDEVDAHEPTEQDNTIILLIQRYDGISLQDIEAEKPSLYQRTLGRLLPKFESDTSATGLYPAQPPLSIPEPVMPQSRPTQPAPIQPQTTDIQQAPLPVQPSSVSTAAHSALPSVRLDQPQPHQASAQQVIPNQPITQHKVNNSLTRLPNSHQSIKPYQELLTQAIIRKANQEKSILTLSPITTITLKSKDSLTTAMIERLFESFSMAATNKDNASHDAIDLVSYGYEVLKPALKGIGIEMSDDTQFALNTNNKATSQDFARLDRGEVISNEINLGIIFSTKSNHASNQKPPKLSDDHTNTLNTSDPIQIQSSKYAQHSNRNLNHQQITLLIKVSDRLGERQQKISQFPINFVGSDSKRQAHSIKLFDETKQENYFDIIELDGQVFIDNISQQIIIERQGEYLVAGTVLMPNDILSVKSATDIITVQLLLSM